MLLGAHSVDKSHLLLAAKRAQLGCAAGGTRDEAIQHACEHGGGVGHRLARVQLQIVRAIADNAGAEAQGSTGKRCARPRGRHPKVGSNNTPAQYWARPGGVGREIAAAVDEPQQIVVVEISDRDELPTVEAQRCLPAHSLGPHASASEGRLRVTERGGNEFSRQL